MIGRSDCYNYICESKHVAIIERHGGHWGAGLLRGTSAHCQATLMLFRRPSSPRPDALSSRSRAQLPAWRSHRMQCL